MSEHDTHFHNTEDDIDNINNGSCARQAPKENDYEQEILEIDYLNIYLFDSRFLTHHLFERPSAALGLGGCFFHAFQSTFLQLLKIMIYHSGTLVLVSLSIVPSRYMYC